MTQQTFSTKELADTVGIHVNTVRFYEQIGFLTPPERLANGYRVFTPVHLEQCRLIRLAMRAEVLQNGLRKKAVEVVQKCAALDFDGALACADEYSAMIAREIANASDAVKTVESTLRTKNAEHPSAVLKKREAAAALNLTPETLRTWERSGLIKTARSEKGCCVYTHADMERLNIIRTLRCANYSLSAILRLMTQLDAKSSQSVEAILNTPRDDEDIVSVCDRLIVSLKSTARDAERIKEMIEKIKTLQ